MILKTSNEKNIEKLNKMKNNPWPKSYSIDVQPIKNDITNNENNFPKRIILESSKKKVVIDSLLTNNHSKQSIKEPNPDEDENDELSKCLFMLNINLNNSNLNFEKHNKQIPFFGPSQLSGQRVYLRNLKRFCLKRKLQSMKKLIRSRKENKLNYMKKSLSSCHESSIKEDMDELLEDEFGRENIYDNKSCYETPSRSKKIKPQFPEKNNLSRCFKDEKSALESNWGFLNVDESLLAKKCFLKNERIFKIKKQPNFEYLVNNSYVNDQNSSKLYNKIHTENNAAFCVNSIIELKKDFSLMTPKKSKHPNDSSSKKKNISSCSQILEQDSKLN